MTESRLTKMVEMKGAKKMKLKKEVESERKR